MVKKNLNPADWNSLAKFFLELLARRKVLAGCTPQGGRVPSGLRKLLTCSPGSSAVNSIPRRGWTKNRKDVALCTNVQNIFYFSFLSPLVSNEHLGEKSRCLNKGCQLYAGVRYFCNYFSWVSAETGTISDPPPLCTNEGLGPTNIHHSFCHRGEKQNFYPCLEPKPSNQKNQKIPQRRTFAKHPER